MFSKNKSLILNKGPWNWDQYVYVTFSSSISHFKQDRSELLEERRGPIKTQSMARRMPKELSDFNPGSTQVERFTHRHLEQFLLHR